MKNLGKAFENHERSRIVYNFSNKEEEVEQEEN